MSDVQYDKMQLRFNKRKSHQGVSLTDYDLDENKPWTWAVLCFLKKFEHISVY